MTTQFRELPGRAPSSVADRGKIADEQEAGAAWLSDDGQHIRLWDQIDGTCTGWLNRQHSEQVTLRSLVYRCTACTFTDPFPEPVEAHIKATPGRVKSHEGAEMIPLPPGEDKVPRERCSACGMTMQIDGQRSAEHLATLSRDVGEAHERAEVKLVHRFGLTPPAVSRNGPVQNSAVPAVSVASQEDRSPRHAPGKRRRGRRGGRKR